MHYLWCVRSFCQSSIAALQRPETGRSAYAAAIAAVAAAIQLSSQQVA
jgi:hypothetical protein